MNPEPSPKDTAAKADEVLTFVREALALSCNCRAVRYEMFAAGGVASALFTTPESRREFLKSPQYAKIKRLLAEMPK
jgi:hypothetical protein